MRLAGKVAFIALMVPFISVAQAEDAGKWYVSGALGITATEEADASVEGEGSGDVDLDTAIHFAGAFGRKFQNNLRAELELSYREADLDSVGIDGVGSTDVAGDLTTLAVMVNGYYDIPVQERLNLYISGGIGFARHEGDIRVGTISADEDDNVFAYQAGAGLGYDLSDRATIFGGYRYFSSSDPEFDDIEAEYAAHEGRFGVMFHF